MKIRGIMIPDGKASYKGETIALPLPETVRIPMAMCESQVCTPTVKEGDRVLVGQLIGKGAEGDIPVHASVSGTVKGICEVKLAGGRKCAAVEIASDGEQKLSPDIRPPVINGRGDLIEAVRQSGCVGLSGSGYSTADKLESCREADIFIVNAAECDPCLTADYRAMLEDTEDIVDGIRVIKKAMGIERVIIAVGRDMESAIEALKTKLGDDKDGIEIAPIREDYPAGANIVLIKNLTGRAVKLGEKPADVKVLLLNVSTVGFLGQYFKTGVPLVERRVTVDGDIVRTPCNLRVPVGTPAAALFGFAETNLKAADRMAAGGAMMGEGFTDADMPVYKSCNGLMAFIKPLEDKKRGKLFSPSDISECIRCRSCLGACPVRLMPMRLEKAFDKGDVKALKRLGAAHCIECGSCTYVCPANRRLTEKIKQAKALL